MSLLGAENERMPTTGGIRLKQILRGAGKGGVDNVEVGFYSSAKYQDGTPVTNVAAWNEFGTSKIPARPFMRNANKDLKDTVPQYIKNKVDPKTMVVTPQMAAEVGEIAKSRIQQEIVDLKEPPNAPATLALKSPKSNPLVNTGTLRRSVT